MVQQGPEAVRGVGGLIYLSDSHYYKLKANVGTGTNNLGEFMALKILMKTSMDLRLRHLRSLGTPTWSFPG